jgi:hypothetical protein
VGFEAMQRTVLHAVGKHSTALSILHNQIDSEVLDEEGAVVAKGLSVEGVEDGMSGTIGSGGAASGLTSLSELQGLTSEGSLVDGSVGVTREWHSIALQFDDGGWSLAAHILDGVLISEPIRSLDCVVRVPTPVVLAHVSNGSIDSSLLRGQKIKIKW